MWVQVLHWGDYFLKIHGGFEFYLLLVHGNHQFVAICLFLKVVSMREEEDTIYSVEVDTSKEEGRIGLELEAGSFVLVYHEQLIPVDQLVKVSYEDFEEVNNHDLELVYVVLEEVDSHDLEGVHDVLLVGDSHDLERVQYAPEVEGNHDLAVAVDTLEEEDNQS